MTERKKTILVGGFLGLFQAGGAVWDYVQYPLGLYLMGHDAYYLEDTMMYPVYSSEWNNSKPLIDRLRGIMKSFGLEDRWIYRDEVTQTFYGKTEREFRNICQRADIFLNVSCANVIRDEYASIPVRIMLDSDPMFTQIQMVSGQSFTTDKSRLMEMANWYTHHFTFGENINHDNCLIPQTPFQWKVTRQPVCLDFWKPECNPPVDAPFTTLMNWKAGKKLMYNGQTWGQKDVTFPMILEIPGLVPEENFKIAVNETYAESLDLEMSSLNDKGWNIVSSEEASGDHLIYKDFICHSKAEISVAKETYVKANTGWFSCRSACYLASGRPVITQDTGWSSFYPVGKGLFSFTNKNEAIKAIREVSSDWNVHSDAAREIAEAYFDHRIVFNEMLSSI